MPKDTEKTVKEKTEKTTVKPAKMPSFYQAVGRRKTATARVRLYPVNKEKITVGNLHLGKDEIYVNEKPAKEYFAGLIFERTYLEPLKATNNMGRFAITAKVAGSGPHGQVGAVVHGISRALLEVDKEAYRSTLKKLGLLTRDPRMKERRKAGLAGKARAGKQSPKR